MLIRHVLIIATMTVLEGLRNRALLGMLLFVMLTGTISLILVPLFAFEQSKVLLDFGFAFMQLSGLVMIFFLAISMISRDIQQRSACMVLSRPVKRSCYLFGRYLGLLLVLFASMAFVLTITGIGGLTLTNIFSNTGLPRNFSPLVFFIVFFSSYLSYCLLLAYALFFSVSTTNVYLSMLATLGIYIIGQFIEPVTQILLAGDFVQMNPAYTKTLQILSWILPNFRAFDYKIFLLYGIPLPYNLFMLSTVYGIIYITFILFFTKLVFDKKDI